MSGANFTETEICDSEPSYLDQPLGQRESSDSAIQDLSRGNGLAFCGSVIIAAMARTNSLLGYQGFSLLDGNTNPSVATYRHGRRCPS
jgi:hypothetical protein